jgi:hypothetical protein
MSLKKTYEITSFAGDIPSIIQLLTRQVNTAKVRVVRAPRDDNSCRSSDGDIVESLTWCPSELNREVGAKNYNN